jgi:hypothetical protein
MGNPRKRWWIAFSATSILAGNLSRSNSIAAALGKRWANAHRYGEGGFVGEMRLDTASGLVGSPNEQKWNYPFAALYNSNHCAKLQN